MRELAGYIAGALKRKLPAEIAERAKVHLVCTFAAMVSGAHLLPGRRAIAYVKPIKAAKEAGVAGTNHVTSVLHAAFVNGMLGHADESDDMHPPTRSEPGTNVIPAALALAERDELSGEKLLRAMMLGYDIGTRVILALKQEVMMKAWHNCSARAGLFGAAAASAALLGFNEKKVRYVLSYCGQQASGLYTTVRDTQHIEKAYTLGGMPAHNGLAAALMVASGFTGLEDVMSGEPNLLSTYSPGTADPEALVRGLGTEFEVMRCAIKCWPAAGPCQGPLQVLHEMIREHGIRAGDVVKLVARLPNKELEHVDNRDMPSENIQHLMAIMLLDGNITYASAHDYKRIKDPKALRLRSECIEAVGDPSLTDPLRRWRGVIDITLKDGRTLSHQTMAAKGVSDNPLTQKEEEEKALDLMGPVLGVKRSRKLMDALFAIERIKNVRTLRPLYSA
jgi:2-methylcitrate dehydratase PrpD